MKITIGIACYNQAEYVREAVESALSQTVPCEVIAVNDGSTDNTLEILKSIKGIKIVNQINKGLPSARNTMVMNMTGDYLLPLDSDDVLLPNCVEKMLEVIKETSADIVAPSFESFGVTCEDVILMDNPTVEDFKTGNRIPYSSAVKKEALLEVGGYSPRMVFGYEDYALWFDLLKRGKKLVTIKDKLMMYRIKPVSMITNAVKHDAELKAQIMKDNKELFPEFFSERP